MTSLLLATPTRPLLLARFCLFHFRNHIMFKMNHEESPESFLYSLNIDAWYEFDKLTRKIHAMDYLFGMIASDPK